MAERKVFTVEPSGPPAAPDFELAGEVFYCVTDEELSSLDVLDYVAALTGRNGIARIQAMVELFDTMLPAGDTERFRKTVKDNRVRLPLLNEIATWVLDAYLHFPTQEEASPSSNGSSDGSSSNEAVSSVPPDVTSQT